MRLSEYEVRAIKEVVALMDEKADVYLFGSRVDDHKKGGDIDLLIFSDKLTQGDSSRLRDLLYDRIGEQKIDLIIEKDMTNPFTRVVMREAIRL